MWGNKSESLRSKFIISGALTGILTLGLAGLGLWIAMSLGDALRSTHTAATALQNHTHADMMHDALRSDVMIALETGAHGDGQAKQTAKDDTAEHITLFKQDVKANQALELPEEVTAVIAAIEAPMAEYLEHADQMVTLGLDTPDAARARLPEFLETFRVLEDAMGSASDQILEATAKANEASGRMAFYGRISMIVAAIAGVGRAHHWRRAAWRLRSPISSMSWRMLPAAFTRALVAWIIWTPYSRLTVKNCWGPMALAAGSIC